MLFFFNTALLAEGFDLVGTSRYSWAMEYYLSDDITVAPASPGSFTPPDTLPVAPAGPGFSPVPAPLVAGGAGEVRVEGAGSVTVEGGGEVRIYPGPQNIPAEVSVGGIVSVIT